MGDGLGGGAARRRGTTVFAGGQVGCLPCCYMMACLTREDVWMLRGQICEDLIPPTASPP